MLLMLVMIPLIIQVEEMEMIAALLICPVLWILLIGLLYVVPLLTYPMLLISPIGSLLCSSSRLLWLSLMLRRFLPLCLIPTQLTLVSTGLHRHQASYYWLQNSLNTNSYSKIHSSTIYIATMGPKQGGV